MFRFTTRGAAYERGEQQGKACREIALPWLRARLRQATQHTREGMKRWLDRIVRVYPEGVEECRGIAQGLGIDEDSYFFAHYSFIHQPPQCTTCGLRDQQGNPLLAKTDDLFADEIGKNILETTIPDKGYRHLHFHFTGSIFTIAGMNECGLAIAMTGIPGPSLDGEGMPSLMALHTILPICSTVQETAEHLKQLKINCYGFSLLIGDAAGDMMLVEKTGHGMVILDANDRAPVVHTNHILHPAFAAKNPSQSEPVLSNGIRRYENAVAKARVIDRSEQGLREFLSDRDPVGAIFQQGENDLHTDFAVIFNPVRKQVAFWRGLPASIAPETISIAECLAS